MVKGKAKKAGAKSNKRSVKTAGVSSRKITKQSKPVTLNSLNKWNWILAGLHALQGVLILVLGNAYHLPITTHFLAKDTLATEGTGSLVLSPGVRHLFDLNIVYLIAAFFFMSAIAHLLSAKFLRSRYESNLKNGINRIRWIEYSFSASTMIVAIALIAGIYDISTLLMMFGLVGVMNLLGLAMEVHNNKHSKVNWITYIIGCIAGILPWVVYVIYVWGSSAYGNAAPPTFVYFILGSIFVLFNSFAINMLLQYRKKGRWSDYLYGERGYMVLSLLAKSALAWQVYAGVLRP